MGNARKTAAVALTKVDENNAYSNIVLNDALKKAELSKEDTALASALFYGTLDRKITVDYYLSKFIKTPLKKIPPFSLAVLRSAVYQIKFMTRIPQSAAVNEAVKLVKCSKENRMSGLTNAVLRNIIRNDIKLPDGSGLNSLSVRYSCPEWIVKSFIDDYGADTAESLLAESLETPPVTFRVNTLKTDFDSLKRSLENEKTEISPCENIENHFEFKTHCAVERLPQFLDGLFHVQDIASAICVKSLELDENMTFIDVCSAPGGKTFTAAQYMKNKGKIYAFDLYEHRVKLISEGAERLGIDIISPQQGDALSLRKDLIGTADRVLCDVPCSGLGVIGKKPEIRYKNLDLIDKLTQTQYNILINASEYLKPDGLLVYSTCSLNKAENEDVCDRFLSEHSNFEKHKDYLTLFPHINNSDGFFIAVFRRI